MKYCALHSLLSFQLCSLSCSANLTPLTPRESCQLGVTRKEGRREGSVFRGLQGRGAFCGWARFKRLERQEFKLLLCVRVRAIVCVYRVCTCVGVCTMPVLRVCVGGCYVCACLYTSCPGWDMETQEHRVRESGLLCARTRVCATLSVPVTACSTDTRMNWVSVTLPPFPVHSCYSTLVAVSLGKVCVCVASVYL